VADWKGKLSFYAGGSSASVDIVSQEYGIQVNYKGDVGASGPAYRQLAALEDGLAVLFSGSFLTKNDVIEEESWTNWGRMDNPAFRFRFTEFRADRIGKVQQEERERRESMHRQRREQFVRDQVKKDRSTFLVWLSGLNSAGGKVFLGVAEGVVVDEVKIFVDDSWHYSPKQVRLQAAQNLWDKWARISTASGRAGNADAARIRIVDQNGNEVGGSRVWAGSLIWVQD